MGLEQHQDIRTILHDLEQCAPDDFIEKHAKTLISLLLELQEWRDSNSKTEGGENILERQSRVIVEGFSDDSAAEALSEALNKASHYFTEQLDVSITLKQLTELHEGGHRAVLELHITPLTLKYKEHIQSLDIENKRFRTKEFKQQIKFEEEEPRHLIFDHYVRKVGASASAIPDHFLINVGDANLMNYMIDKEFFKAGHPSSPHMDKVLVKSHDSLEPEPE